MIEILIGPTETVRLVEEPPDRQRRDPTPVGCPGKHPVAIQVVEACLLEAHHHAASSLAEIGGLLLGRASTWEGHYHIEVSAILAAAQTLAGPTHVTFTADTWAALLERHEREHSELQIVGWYHSHPRMGIFLSEMDLTIHRHFFPQPWHIALVINGQDRLAGFFSWNGTAIEEQSGFQVVQQTSATERLEWRADHHPFCYELLSVPTEAKIEAEPERHPSSFSWLLFAGVGLAAVLLWLLARHWREPDPTTVADGRIEPGAAKRDRQKRG